MPSNWAGRRAGQIRVGWGGIPWEETLGSPKESHGRGPMGGEPLGPQGIPWEGSGTPHGRGPLGTQGIPWEGKPWEPKGPVGEDLWEPKGSPGRGPLEPQGISHGRGTLGSPGAKGRAILAQGPRAELKQHMNNTTFFEKLAHRIIVYPKFPKQLLARSTFVFFAWHPPTE